MSIFSGFQSCLCVGSGEIFSIVENEKQSFTLQKSAENFIAQQNIKESQFRNRSQKNIPFVVEMEKGHSCCRKVQKTLLHNRKLRKVNLMAETGEKFILRQKQRISPFCSVFPWTLDSTFAYKLAMAKCTLEPILLSVRPNFLLRKSLN